MLSLPGRNLQNFVKHRPPETIIAICLLSFTLSAFSLACYVKYAERVLNIDEQENWSSFFKYVNKRKYCILKNVTVDDKNDSSLFKTVFVPAKIVFSNINSVELSEYDLKGILPLNDFESNCPGNFSQDDVYVIFSIPKVSNNKKRSERICMALEVPIDFYSTSLRPACVPPIVNTKKIAKITSAYLPTKEFCETGIKVDIQIDEKVSKTFEIYLSEIDRVAVYVHLLWLCSFMIFIVILILLCAMFTKTNKEEQF